MAFSSSSSSSSGIESRGGLTRELREKAGLVRPERPSRPPKELYSHETAEQNIPIEIPEFLATPELVSFHSKKNGRSFGTAGTFAAGLRFIGEETYAADKVRSREWPSGYVVRPMDFANECKGGSVFLDIDGKMREGPAIPTTSSVKAKAPKPSADSSDPGPSASSSSSGKTAASSAAKFKIILKPGNPKPIRVSGVQAGAGAKVLKSARGSLLVPTDTHS